jgi:hypothetical protein
VRSVAGYDDNGGADSDGALSLIVDGTDSDDEERGENPARGDAGAEWAGNEARRQKLRAFADDLEQRMLDRYTPASSTAPGGRERERDQRDQRGGAGGAGGGGAGGGGSGESSKQDTPCSIK